MPWITLLLCLAAVLSFLVAIPWRALDPARINLFAAAFFCTTICALMWHLGHGGR